MDDAFAKEIEEALLRGAPFDELIAIVRTQRDAGLAQTAAYEALERLRRRIPERLEDRVLELEDIVSGFCAPAARLW